MQAAPPSRALPAAWTSWLFGLLLLLQGGFATATSLPALTADLATALVAPTDDASAPPADSDGDMAGLPGATVPEFQPAPGPGLHAPVIGPMPAARRLAHPSRAPPLS